MTLTIAAVLHLVAFFLFVFAAAGVPSRINLTAAGLAVWMFSLTPARSGACCPVRRRRRRPP